jgi:hypothetical protein
MQPWSSSGGAGGFPVAAEIQRILALSDLTLRNLFITQARSFPDSLRTINDPDLTALLKPSGRL